MGLGFFLILTLLFWGIAPVFAKIGLVKVEPIVALAIRTFIIGLILLIFCIFTGKLTAIGQVSFKDVLFIGAEGVFASLLGHLGYYYSLKLGDVSKVSPLLAAYPLITVIAAVLFLNEKITVNKVIGFTAIVFGLFFMKK